MAWTNVGTAAAVTYMLNEAIIMICIGAPEAPSPRPLTRFFHLRECVWDGCARLRARPPLDRARAQHERGSVHGSTSSCCMGLRSAMRPTASRRRGHGNARVAHARDARATSHGLGPQTACQPLLYCKKACGHRRKRAASAEDARADSRNCAVPRPSAWRSSPSATLNI